VQGKIHFHSEVQNVVTSGYVELLAKQQTRPQVELTQREEEIVKLLAREYTNDRIAETLNISYRTVETHRKNMMQKTNSHNLAGLLKYAYSNGIIK
jgi:DNA-binding NarL/FixJ family response regulator